MDTLIETGEIRESEGDTERAIRLYSDALTLDGSSQSGYLHLASAREKTGDLREAWRVYDVALAHLPAFDEARTRRAELRFKLGFVEPAERDLEDVLARHIVITTVRTLARYYGSHGQRPAQLALWRRVRLHAILTENVELAGEARLQVAALQALVAESDPAIAPERPALWFRTSVAKLARRPP